MIKKAPKNAKRDIDRKKKVLRKLLKPRTGWNATLTNTRI